MSNPYRKKSAVTGEAYDPKKAPRYTEIPTFMRTPHGRRLTDLDIAIVGVPYDSGVTNRPGARHGPREIRNMSSLTRTIHHVSRLNPYELCRVGDVGDVDVDQEQADLVQLRSTELVDQIEELLAVLVDLLDGQLRGNM